LTLTLVGEPTALTIPQINLPLYGWEEKKGEQGRAHGIDGRLFLLSSPLLSSPPLSFHPPPLRSLPVLSCPSTPLLLSFLSPPLGGIRLC